MVTVAGVLILASTTFMSSRNSPRDNVVESGFGDILGVSAGAALGLQATIIADAGRKYPHANLMAIGCLGAAITTTGSLLLQHGHVLEQCYPHSGSAFGYEWPLIDGILVATTGMMQNLSVKYCAPVVFGLLSLLDMVLEPALIWLFLGERPLQTTIVFGVLLMVILAVHEMVAYAVEPDDSEPTKPTARPTESTPLLTSP